MTQFQYAISESAPASPQVIIAGKQFIFLSFSAPPIFNLLSIPISIFLPLTLSLLILKTHFQNKFTLFLTNTYEFSTTIPIALFEGLTIMLCW